MVDFKRLHRYRRSASLRHLFEDVVIRPSDFIAPLFIHEQAGKQPLSSLQGHYRFDLPHAVAYIQRLLDVGIRSFIIFPVISADKKTLCCSYALDDNGLIPRALRLFKKEFPSAIFIADIALDPFHLKGHDGILTAQGAIDNDASCHVLAQQALCYALSGADIIAPSDMMDGRIQCIRGALEARGLHQTLIASYAIKYASCLYGPFRDAVDSAQYLGASDKKTYQLDPASRFQALLEAQHDIAEDADLLIVKPGMSYLDIINTVSTEHSVPIWSYHVSGECAMLHAGANAGIFRLDDILMEHFIAQKRAGAQKIITYFAVEGAQLFKY
jgi:porphobilinogen synthase